MPDVESQQLDLALSDIKRAGFEDEVEVVGGGTFGVIDESAWTVCTQEPAAGSTIDAQPRLTVDRECGGAADGGGAAEEQAPEEAPSEEERSPESEPEDETEPEQPQQVETFVMPALVGANLQDAQDLLQVNGSYVLTQIDATGLERFQVLDSAWQVCGQRPVPGATVAIDRLVRLDVVKLGEACP